MTAHFEIRGNIIVFISDTPGSHVAMFGPNRARLKERPDVSVFQRDHNRYLWAFEYLGQHADGQRFVFATSDRIVVGKRLGSDFKIVDPDVDVIRDPEGRSIRLHGSLPPINTLLPLGAHASQPAFSAIEPQLLSRPRVASSPRPRVSIITCCYNRAQMLLECIASVRAQTDESWEHLIYDNGSTDSAVQSTLERAAALDSRVRVWRKTPNIDQPARFWNELLDRARGQYITFLDDDNLKHPRFIETLATVLDEDPTIDMVTCGWLVIDKSDGTSECHLNTITTPAAIHGGNTIDTASSLIRRESLERIGYFPLNIRTNEDWALARRAVEHLNIVHLPEVLTTYRCHDGQRMEYCDYLGNERDKTMVHKAIWGATYGVRVFSAAPERLTMSQRDVVEGARAGIADIPWLEEGSDLAIVLMPFQMDIADLEAIAANHHAVVSVHSEDPFALNANLDKVRAMTAMCDDVWVASNDTTCLDEYRSLVGEKVIVCPSLSIDHRAEMARGEPLYDALLVGYAYPGRVRYIKEFLGHFDRQRLKIVGDGWREEGFDATPTTRFLDTAPFYRQAKAVICLHRGQGDCVDGPYEPRLAQRGYVEALGGARVFVDKSRPDHAFDEGEVEWFASPHDLFIKLDRYLSLPAPKQELLAAPLRERALRDFTYRTRMARVINSVRSPRYGAVIP